ncbi:MAG: 30S ribosomal protein S9 [Candidatus Omnitrophota bacterium]
MATGKNTDKYRATGRRKEASARIMIQSGDGKIKVNKRVFEEYFIRETHRLIIMQPFNITNTKGKFNVTVNVAGGGMTGQAMAVRHGISRALVLADEAYKKALKTGGFLTRDSRRKERKKYGQKRARKRFQYSKR